MASSRHTEPTARPSAGGLGISTDKPKYPHYAVLSKRLESFETENWSGRSRDFKQDLAEAGFVSTDVGDAVRCYFSGGGLRNWEAGDKPMIEHARWYPKCGHLILVKGQDFINKVVEDKLETEDDLKGETAEKEIELRESCATQALLENGYTKENIELASRKFIQKNGKTTYTAEELFKILMDMEENPATFVVQETADSIDSCTNEDLSDDLIEEEVKRLGEENERLRDNHLCRICLEHLSDIVFLPCAHVVACGQCAAAVNKCPICRKVISGFVKSIFAGNSELT